VLTRHPVDAIQTLQAVVQGPVLRAGDADYDGARRVWNAMIDRSPALIVRCTSTADVAAAIRFARDQNLPLTIRGGGHSVAGKAVCDDGLMVDLSLMQGIEVDAERRVAHAQGGVTWGAFDTATQLVGLATTGGIVATTGVAGLTLGGGLGFLMRRFGLTCDNLLAAEVVTADGEVLEASEQAHPDLFWALRGGSGNFGVVTTFTFRLHPLTTVLGGMVAYPLSNAAAVARHYREYTATAPDDATVYLNFEPAPDGQPVVSLDVCYCGPIISGDAVIAPLRALGQPLSDTVAPIPYLSMQTMLAETYPPGLLRYWKSSFLDGLSDEAIDALLACITRAPTSGLKVHIEQLGGAVARVPVVATAFSDRTAAFTLLVTGAWTDPAETAASVAWVRETWDALQPYARASAYINYLDVGEDARIAAVYGPNYQRLAEVKRSYDPDNIFRHNLNIRPAGIAAGPPDDV
jgi:FAD/FMN-containing dehydrogenase